MSRIDQVINTLLVLAWIVLIVRLGRIYLLDEPVDSSLVATSGGGSVGGAPITLVRAASLRGQVARLTRCARRKRLSAPMLALSAPPHPPPPTTPARCRAQPTPTSITGPQALRPIVGKCFYFLEKDGGRKYEFCAYRSVRMIMMSNYQANVAGHWKDWKTEAGADGKLKYISQLYTNGEVCTGFGARECEVIFKVR